MRWSEPVHTVNDSRVPDASTSCIGVSKSTKAMGKELEQIPSLPKDPSSHEYEATPDALPVLLPLLRRYPSARGLNGQE